MAAPFSSPTRADHPSPYSHTVHDIMFPAVSWTPRDAHQWMLRWIAGRNHERYRSLYNGYVERKGNYFHAKLTDIKEEGYCSFSTRKLTEGVLIRYGFYNCLPSPYYTPQSSPPRRSPPRTSLPVYSAPLPPRAVSFYSAPSPPLSYLAPENYPSAKPRNLRPSS